MKLTFNKGILVKILLDIRVFDRESLNIDNKKIRSRKLLTFAFPIIFLIIIASSIPNLKTESRNICYDSYITERGVHDSDIKRELINILSNSDLASNLIDTVYTDKDCWLELRIDRQMLYQHWRNGQTEKYPVSSGNKYLDKGVESRPGLFAIFFKEAHHQSTQFNNADMYHFMPFNQGIGFHSLDGNGYYGTLGVAPSSHGCIRMRRNDAEKLFKDCPLGTLVLAHRGSTLRTVGFAPEGYKNPEEYTKDNYKLMLSKNLYNILEGNYYVNERYFFVVDPNAIPKTGVYIAYDGKLPEHQKMPLNSFKIYYYADRLRSEMILPLTVASSDSNLVSEIFSDLIDDSESADGHLNENLTDKDLIKEYFNNPIGILPYYGPDK